VKSILLALLISSPAFAAVFGVDDRVSIRPGSLGYALSRSTAVAVLSANFEPVSEGKIRLNVDKLDEMFCPSVKFSKQVSLSYACTGFLVGPDLIATAGHCMVNTGESRNETEIYCKNFSWLFDFNETTNPENVSAENHYTCKRVIYAVKDEKAPFRDFALVQLTRPVKGRTPLKLSAAPISSSTTLSMIGHPFGLPAKLSRKARTLINNPLRGSFLTSLDAFDGNSGSPVFNANNEVVGILIGGTPSANTVINGRCEVLNRCSENGTNCLENGTNTSIFSGHQGVGSEVQRIQPVMKLIKSL
jgi:V8-like Glu-specific endopeptidase